MAAARRFILFVMMFVLSMVWIPGFQGRAFHPLTENSMFFDLPLWLIRLLLMVPFEALFLGLATYFFIRLLQSPNNRPCLPIFIAISLFLLALLALGVVGDLTAITAYYPQIRFALVLWFQYTLAYLFLPKPHM